MLEERLNELRKALTQEASLTEYMVKSSILGLIRQDADILKKVIEEEEEKLNKMELQLDEFCINFIALYQPEATYLRTVLMVYRINNDLERIGDLAVNIAESSLYLISHPQVKPLIDIPKMANISIDMLKMAIDSFLYGNLNIAGNVLEQDKVVDNLRDQILRELITYMASDPSTIERSIHLIRISRCLERIADLSTNICEDVIFMVSGKVIRHHNDL